MGPLGFSRPALWLQFLTIDGRADGMITKIEDVPARPDEALLHNLMRVCGQMLDSDLRGGKTAFLWSRPGRGIMTDDDRAWARGLTAAAHNAGVPCEPVHLATDEELRVFAPDDLLRPGTAA